MPLIRLRTALAVLLLGLSCIAHAQDAAPRKLRVLFVGNSLTYVNDLPATFRALAASQPAPVAIETQTFVEPGGSLADRWNDGKAAAALAGGHWDALVLQERGGVLACMVDSEQRSSVDCRASERAHREFAAKAKAVGTPVYLLATWGPDDTWQGKLDRAAKQIASRTDAKVIPAGKALRALAHRNGDKATFPDTVHPSLVATLVMAAQLHEAIVGAWPQPADVTLDFALLPANAAVTADTPMESQEQLKGQPKKTVVKADAMAVVIDAAK
ncbi:SGNH/GDSL hydrolase family protein [Noviluteimonas dokdonensis]|nr:SGNH/GDSL hydrolase family protein [Lysobacter dokdonensis]